MQKFFGLIHPLCLYLFCCQLLVNMQINLKVCCFHILHNVFKPLKLFTCKFLNISGNCKFKYLALAVLEDDTNHFQQQKSYNKENISEHLFLKKFSPKHRFLPERSHFFCLWHCHLYLEGTDFVLIFWKQMHLSDRSDDHCFCSRLLLWLTKSSNWGWENCLSWHFLVIYWHH